MRDTTTQMMEKIHFIYFTLLYNNSTVDELATLWQLFGILLLLKEIFRNNLRAFKISFITAASILLFHFQFAGQSAAKTRQWKTIAQCLNECFKQNIYICQNMTTYRLFVWEYFCRHF